MQEMHIHFDAHILNTEGRQETYQIEATEMRPRMNWISDIN